MDQAVRSTLLVCSGLLSPLGAQTTWERTLFLPGREGHAMTEDYARRRVVLFGGKGGGLRDDTWEWDGTRWTERQPSRRPPARFKHGMAYDFTGGRVLLFGGSDSTRALNDTWAWDGTDWQQLQPVTSPAPRAEFAMTTDLVRGVALLHGGWSNAPFFDDLWEWTGSNWFQHTPGVRPSGRVGHGLAFDLLRGVTVLYGGFGTQATETWEWDGTRWSMAQAGSPPGLGLRVGLAMGFSLTRGRVVLHGGAIGVPLTWEWDGSQWTQVASATSPAERSRHAMAYDLNRGTLLMFGGLAAGELADTWELGTSGWSLVADANVPTGRSNHGFGYDPMRRRCVLFGGMARGGNGFVNDTWELAGEAWQRQTPATVPAGQLPLGMAWDSHRRRMVLLLATSIDSRGIPTVWEWDGTDWQQRPAPGGPVATQNLALAFDEQRGRLTVFGGAQYPNVNVPADTWELEGQTGAAWRRVATTGPSARDSAALAWDPVRGVAILFGGRSFNPTRYHGDTWQWDGFRWSQLLPANAPPAQLGHRMVWDTARRRLVLRGWSRETWEWDGVDWQRRVTSQEPPSVGGQGMVYDQGRQQVILFGGQLSITDHSAERWQYRPVSAASHAAYGRGCAGSGGIPALTSDFGPWRGAEFVQRVDQLAPGVLLIGASRTAWGGVPLPLDLGAIGMPGCALRASTTLILPLLPDASARVAIPDDAALVGARLYNQAVQLAPGANPLGAIVSDAVAAVIGAR